MQSAETKRYSVLTGFPCNNNTAYVVMTPNNELFITVKKEAYDKAISEGYIDYADSKDCDFVKK